MTLTLVRAGFFTEPGPQTMSPATFGTRRPYNCQRSRDQFSAIGHDFCPREDIEKLSQDLVCALIWASPYEKLIIEAAHNVRVEHAKAK